jgi:hypothetical protein
VPWVPYSKLNSLLFLIRRLFHDSFKEPRNDCLPLSIWSCCTCFGLGRAPACSQPLTDGPDWVTVATCFTALPGCPLQIAPTFSQGNTLGRLRRDSFSSFPEVMGHVMVAAEGQPKIVPRVNAAAISARPTNLCTYDSQHSGELTYFALVAS